MVRLAEKTLELTICSQLSLAWGRRVVWFGLTQRQEAAYGFDAWTQLGGRLLFFQFKASSEDAGGARRFRAENQQMQTLINMFNGTIGQAFYVLPLIGTHAELVNAGGNVLPACWLLDIGSLGPVPAPTKRNGQPRVSGLHYLDVMPPVVWIRSEPVKKELAKPTEVLRRTRPLENLTTSRFKQICHAFKRRAVGAVVPA